jgi:hypothetical protein
MCADRVEGLVARGQDALMPNSLILNAMDRAERARTSPYALLLAMSDDPDGASALHAPYVWMLCAIVAAFTPRRPQRALINAPPGSLMALIGVELHIAWRLGHHPASVIEVFFRDATDLESCAQAAHRLLTADTFCEIFRETRLKSVPADLRQLRTTRGGCVTFRMLGDVQPGPPADLIVFNSPQQARDVASEEARDLSFDLYELACRRLSARGSALTLMPRWHEDDISARLIARGDYAVWSFPLIAEYRTEIRLGNFGLKRIAGDVLDPAIWPPSGIALLKQGVSPETFAARYQQAPMSSPDGP